MDINPKTLADTIVEVYQRGRTDELANVKNVIYRESVAVSPALDETQVALPPLEKAKPPQIDTDTLKKVLDAKGRPNHRSLTRAIRVLRFAGFEVVEPVPAAE